MDEGGYHYEVMRRAIELVDAKGPAATLEDLAAGMELDAMPPMGRFHTDLDEASASHYVGVAAGSCWRSWGRAVGQPACWPGRSCRGCCRVQAASCVQDWDEAAGAGWRQRPGQGSHA